MRRGPVLIGTVLVIAAFAILINYDNQFRALMLGSAPLGAGGQLPAGGGVNQGGFGQRVPLAQGLTTFALIRLSSYVIGAAGIMVILIGTAIPPKKTTEAS
jgi:hypothetical protein